MDQMELQTTQRELRDALAQKDLKFFEIALAMGADPLNPDDRHSCVYEIALSTYGCAKFVQQCLENGCSPNYLNPHLSKAAINYAADSRDPRIINALLRYPKVKVNRKLCPQSPVNALIINATDDNANDVIACLTALLEYGAFISVADQTKHTPLYHLEHNRQLLAVKQRERIEKLLLYYMTDEDFTKTHLHKFLRPSIKGRLRTLSVHRSRQPLDSTLLTVTGGSLSKFKEQFRLAHLSEGDKVRLLLESIEKDEDEIFEFLLVQSNVDYNGQFDGKSPLLYAVMYSNSYALRRLLDHQDLDLAAVECPLTIALLNMAEERYGTMAEARKCFYLLLQSNRVDINEADCRGNTALHYAVKYRAGEAIRQLLKWGAYIGSRNNAHIMPLDQMSAEQLQQCLDDSIQASGCPWAEEHFEVQLNYDNIMAPSSDSGHHEEMAIAAFMATSKEHRHLLQHPLIASYLWLKWRQLSFLFYANLLLSVLFAVALMMYTLLKFSDWESAPDLTITMWVGCWVGIAYMVVRESLQCFMSPQHYFHTPKNYLELALILVAIMTCSDNRFHLDTRKLISVFCMLLAAFDLFLLFGCLPCQSMTTHMLMLEAVCRTFVKSLLLYSVLVLTFGICFYTLFDDVKEKPVLPPDEGTDVRTRGDFNEFSNSLKAIVKTIVMLTGDFEAGAIAFDTLPSYLLFLMFVLLMAIVLYNVFIGLAVSDVQAIRGQTALNEAISRTKLLTRNEGMLNGNSPHVNFLLSYRWLRPICHRLLRLYPKYRHIAIRPNEGNRVNVISCDEAEDSGHIPRSTYFPKMDPDIIKLALGVIERKANNLKTQANMRNIENHLLDIDKKMNEMCELLKNI